MADDVVLHGGPFEGVADGPTSVSLARFRPPYFCGADDDTGAWHHYVWMRASPDPRQAGAVDVEYVYAGLCAGQTHEPDCGHDHARPLPPGASGPNLRPARHTPWAAEHPVSSEREVAS